MDSFERYYLHAIRLLSYRARSEKEVRDNLLKKKSSPEITERIISKLRELKFLNDYEFAKAWIQSRSRSRPKSIGVLQMELRQKGVEKEIIQRVMHDASIFELVNDHAQAKALAAQKIHKYLNLSRDKIYQKLGGLMGRRGFSWEVIKSAIDDALKKGYNS